MWPGPCWRNCRRDHSDQAEDQLTSYGMSCAAASACSVRVIAPRAKPPWSAMTGALVVYKGQSRD